MFKTFKQHPLYLRKEQSARIKIKYPTRIPVIVEKYINSNNTPNIDKNKFLVPKDSTVGSLIHVIRQHIRLSEKQALFLFCNSSIPPTSQVMSIIYDEHKDEDGFLYICFTTDNTFGN